MHHWACLKAIILLLTTGYVYSEEVCSKAVVHSCEDCITSGPDCAWCKHLNFTKSGEQEAVRCNTEKALLDRGCPEKHIISPPNYSHLVKDKPLTSSKTDPDPVQVQPQEIKLHLRPGKPHTFPLTFKRADGYPVDLYYLMDLSYSMKDDLQNVKNLGKSILQELQQITKGKVRIGFGSFVDKTVLPFTDTNKEKLKRPCPNKEGACQSPFGYQHVLGLTDNTDVFSGMVSSQSISGNLDTPEGSLDAIMQAAVCGDKIGWGNNTRLLVVATDAGFHMAGDGKLAAILEPNDEACHLDHNSMYSKSNQLDYPSVGQIAIKLAENNIQPIFAVTENVANIYRDLSQLIPKSEVGVLSSDSSNVVKLIGKAYETLSSNVIMTHDKLPEHVKVTYTSSCVGGERPSDKGTCDNVKIGDLVTFLVTVRVDQCIGDSNVQIGPLGFREKVMVQISTRCECNCDDAINTAHPHCSSQGQVDCGGCRCNPGFLGSKCECHLGQKDESELKAACRKDNGTECEGRGECMCGRCQCYATDSGGTYYGDHCECDDEHCEKFLNKPCGGKGDCKCGLCECDEGYEGSACHCKKSNEECLTENGTVCHNRGNCVCNQCECKRDYKGPFCRRCPTCEPPCQKSAGCIECLGFNKGPLEKSCKQNCSYIEAELEERLEKDPLHWQCRVKDSDGCWIIFTMTEKAGFDKYTAKILKVRECPEKPNIAAIVGGSLAIVAVIGLLILLIIKALIYMSDLKEVRRFEKEKKTARWQDGSNPLYQKATTEVQNPMYSGE